jgi:hypothetical protein
MATENVGCIGVDVIKSIAVLIVLENHLTGLPSG